MEHQGYSGFLKSTRHVIAVMKAAGNPPICFCHDPINVGDTVNFEKRRYEVVHTVTPPRSLEYLLTDVPQLLQLAIVREPEKC